MKTLLAIAALLTFTAGVAGTSLKVRKVKTGAYDRIMITGDFSVKFVEGREGEIFLEGDRIDINHLVVYTDGNVLRIYPKQNFRAWCGDMESLTVVIPIESISEVVYAGTGKIESHVKIKADRFKTQINGSAQVSLHLETNETEAMLTGSGKLKLSGSTGKFISSVTGDGGLEAYAFHSAATEAIVIGTGNSQISSSETLNAQVAGSGQISYIGNPKIEKTIIGSGLIAARQ
ncbi:head GIN domain-containing protein [Flavobacterium sp.]|uniref:head GIN domain-containing protein n=1 Tax=Flavobacterium sp. TaxID=239 RepID=UPI00120447E7|nr:head GIN domain-containing protein [Flavobacterium sp.]RZJ70132.1 MAG: DUF2807 domain-containing protein [Flavobacterium sp.]